MGELAINGFSQMKIFTDPDKYNINITIKPTLDFFGYFLSFVLY